jgi:hypothetical protein
VLQTGKAIAASAYLRINGNLALAAPPKSKPFNHYLQPPP